MRTGRVSVFQHLVLLILFRVILDFWYVTSIPRLFVEYPPLEWSTFRLIVSLLLTAVAIVALPRRWDRPSYFYLYVILLGVLIPMYVIYAHADVSTPQVLVCTLAFLGISVMVRIRLVALPRLRGLSGVTMVGVVAATIIVFGWLYVSARHLFTFDVSSLYSARLETREHVFVGIWAYLITWTAKIFIPLIMAVGLIGKNRILVVGSILLSVVLFGLTTHKLFLVIGLTPLVLYGLWKTRNPIRNALALAVLMPVAFAMWYWWSGNILVPALGVQRAIFKQGLLNFVYVDVFESRPLILMSHGFLGTIFDYPYDLNPAFLVGRYLKGTAATRSNTGFLGTGVAHFGTVGPLLLGFCVGLVLKVLDSVGRALPLWFRLAITFGPFVSLLTASDFLPALNTQGVVLSILIVWIIAERYGDRYYPYIVRARDRGS